MSLCLKCHPWDHEEKFKQTVFNLNFYDTDAVTFCHPV